MVQAEDEFCRWDAGQKLFTRYIKALINDENTALPVSLITSFKDILRSDIDPALIAEQLTLPSFDEIADNLMEVDPDKVLFAIDKLKQFLATGLATDLLVIYQRLQNDKTQDNQIAVANRALKNISLSYLAMLAEHSAIVNEQYNTATNMTDSLAAITASVKNTLPALSSQLKDFETKWYNTTLVMDKWFSLCVMQASDDIFERLAQLLKHPLFTLQNPNPARSVISAFAMSNPKYFHCKSGRGYLFLVDHIVKLNKINPQIASRLVTPLLAFKRYEPTRQALLKGHLEQLAQLPNLSKDLQEKVSAALA